MIGLKSQFTKILYSLLTVCHPESGIANDKY